MSIAGLLYFQYKDMASDVVKWRNSSYKNEGLFKEQKNLVWTHIAEYAKLESSNEQLQDLIKDNKQKIRNLTEINVSLEDSIYNLSTKPIIIINPDDSSATVKAQEFGHSGGGFLIAGYFEVVDPFRISFTKLIANVELEVALTQSKNRAWSTYVTSINNNITINDVIPKVTPYKPSFLEKLSFNLGTYGGINQIGVLAGASYDKHTMLLLFSNYGGSIGYVRQFKIK